MRVLNLYKELEISIDFKILMQKEEPLQVKFIRKTI